MASNTDMFLKVQESLSSGNRQDLGDIFKVLKNDLDLNRKVLDACFFANHAKEDLDAKALIPFNASEVGQFIALR